MLGAGNDFQRNGAFHANQAARRAARLLLRYVARADHAVLHFPRYAALVAFLAANAALARFGLLFGHDEFSIPFFTARECLRSVSASRWAWQIRLSLSSGPSSSRQQSAVSWYARVAGSRSAIRFVIALAGFDWASELATGDRAGEPGENKFI